MENDKERENGVPACVYEDEVVRYLAGRYHTSTAAIIRRYLVQEGCVEAGDEEGLPRALERNEMAILRDLICLAKGERI